MSLLGSVIFRLSLSLFIFSSTHFLSPVMVTNYRVLLLLLFLRFPAQQWANIFSAFQAMENVLVGKFVSVGRLEMRAGTGNWLSGVTSSRFVRRLQISISTSPPVLECLSKSNC